MSGEAVLETFHWRMRTHGQEPTKKTPHKERGLIDIDEIVEQQRCDKIMTDCSNGQATSIFDNLFRSRFLMELLWRLPEQIPFASRNLTEI